MNDPRFTDMSRVPPSSQHQSTSFNNNNRRSEMYDEDRNVNSTPFFQSKWLLLIPLVVLLLGLLAACIAMAIALAVLVKSIGTGSVNNGMTSTASTTSSTNTAKCGIQSIAPSPTLSRIYGGTQAVPHSWPWMVYYEEQATCDAGSCPVYSCSGILIAPKYVLIAAQCLKNPGSDIFIIAGLHNTQSVTEDAIIQIRQVQTFNIYPTYSDNTLQDDIAILQLATPVDLTDYVGTVCLPDTQPQINDTVIIAGWGSTVYGGNLSNVLNQGFTQVIGNCNAYWSSAQVNTMRQICVANKAIGSSICTGDLGGPLMIQRANQWEVSGLASLLDAPNCNTISSKPNVYTNVAYYLPWINSIINPGLLTIT